MKPFDVAMLCGRFQHIHIGHCHIIDTALSLADRMLILVGSAQETGTLRNPFDIQTRIEMIREVYPFDNVTIKPLNDLTHEEDITPDWGKYVLDNSRRYIHKNPDIFVYGNDESRSKWFDPSDIKSVTEVIVSRAKLDISATKMREFLVKGDIDNWFFYSPPKIHKHCLRLREELLSTPAYKELQL